MLHERHARYFQSVEEAVAASGQLDHLDYAIKRGGHLGPSEYASNSSALAVILASKTEEMPLRPMYDAIYVWLPTPPLSPEEFEAAANLVNPDLGLMSYG